MRRNFLVGLVLLTGSCLGSLPALVKKRARDNMTLARLEGDIQAIQQSLEVVKILRSRAAVGDPILLQMSEVGNLEVFSEVQKELEIAKLSFPSFSPLFALAAREKSLHRELHQAEQTYRCLRAEAELREQRKRAIDYRLKEIEAELENKERRIEEKATSIARIAEVMRDWLSGVDQSEIGSSDWNQLEAASEGLRRVSTAPHATRDDFLAQLEQERARIGCDSKMFWQGAVGETFIKLNRVLAREEATVVALLTERESLIEERSNLD